jgi:SsrA-binding protein
MVTKGEEKPLASNRSAFHEYHISDKYEAGIALTGTEVKSVMGGRIQLKDSYVSVRDGEAWLFNAHISPYSHGNRENHDPLRTRKLLLHKREIGKLDEASARQGMTLVATRVYMRNRHIKLEIGVARGKKLYDKRETEMRRTVDREARAQLKERNQSRQ